MIALLAAAPIWAAPIQLQLDTTEIRAGQSTGATVFVVGKRPKRPPVLPPVDGLAVALVESGQQFKAVNGTLTQIYRYAYRVTATRPGTYLVGPALADAGGPIESNAVELVALERVVAVDEPELSVTARFVPDRAWEGQVLVYTHVLRARGTVSHVEWRLPPFEGLRQLSSTPERHAFTIEDHSIEGAGGDITVEEGRTPVVAVGTGTRTHPGVLAEVRLPLGRERPGRFTQSRIERLASEPVPLTVRPLPEPIPDGFSGLVGDFTVTSGLDVERAAVGQSVSWTVQLAGDGTLEGFALPDPATDTRFRLYSSDSSHTARVSDGAFSALGTYRRVLVPTQPGLLEVEPQTIVAFSPTTGTWTELVIQLPPLQVTPGREGPAHVESFGAPVEALDPEDLIDLRDPFTWGPVRTWSPVPALPALLGAAAAPGLLLALLGAAGRVRSWQERRRLARSGPPSPHDVLSALPDDPVERLAALDGALRLALALRLGVPAEGLDRSAAVDALPDALRGRVAALTAHLDRARFADEPSAGLVDEVQAVVCALEEDE